MNCPKCGTETTAGASHCRRCGAALSTKAAATPSSSDEIDLMPLETSKPAYSAYEAPPGLEGPPPPGGAAVADEEPGNRAGPVLAAGKVSRVRGANASPAKLNLNLIIGGSLAVILILFIAWRLLRTENKAVGTGAKLEQTTLQIQPNQSKVGNFEVTGKINYTFDVTAVDSDLLVGVVQRNPKDPTTVAVLKKLPDTLDPIRKNEPHNMSGELKAGQYSWVIINEGKKAARAKARFSAQ